MLSSISKYARHVSLIPASSLQEYLLIYANRPEAKAVADKLYEVLSSNYTAQPTIIEEDSPHRLKQGDVSYWKDYDFDRLSMFQTMDRKDVHIIYLAELTVSSL